MQKKDKIIFTNYTMRNALLEYMYFNKQLFLYTIIIIFILTGFIFKSYKMIILSFLIFSILYTLTKRKLEKFISYYKNNYRPIIKKKYTISFLKLEGFGGGIMIIHPKNKQYIRWKSIGKIIESKKFLFLIIKDEMIPIILPKRYLTNEQLIYIKEMIKQEN